MCRTNLIKYTPSQETNIYYNYYRQAIKTKYFSEFFQHKNTWQKESSKHKPTGEYVVFVNLNEKSTEFGIW